MVIALVLPEPEEPEPELPELVKPEEPDESEPGVLELAEPEPVEPEEDELEPLDPEELAVDAALGLLWDSAGSCPDTSCTKTTPQIRTNVEAAAARARFRIKTTRLRRAFSRAVTPSRTLDLAVVV